MSNRAVFLDRDGVLVEDLGLLSRAEDLHVLDGVPQALCRLKAAGFRLVVITNQAVVARGLITLEQLVGIHARMSELLTGLGAPPLDGIYVCPHHPHADMSEYRVVCDCRKPRPGLLLRAARELGLDLQASVMVGDRLTDVAAGAKVGCKTVLVHSPATSRMPIVTAEPVDDSIKPDYACDSLEAAADWILDARECE
jgi:D-glycero-D-manno-heptose 1,7-bisphosphate phosphatase